MTSPIAKAIQDVRFSVPLELLKKAFIEPNSAFRSMSSQSLEAQIEALVIRPRVLVDLNLISGQEMLVSLIGLPFERIQTGQTVIHIPKQRTGGRRINSVRNVSFFNSAAIGGLFGGIAGLGTGINGNSVLDSTASVAATAGLMASFDRIPQTSTSNVSLIGENTILINEVLIVPNSSFLRCILENEDNLASLPLRAYRYFSELVKYAVKAHIYYKLVIAIGERELFYGQELGRFKEMVDSYADADQNYQDYLRNTMEKVMFMSDPLSYARFIKNMISHR